MGNVINEVSGVVGAVQAGTDEAVSTGLNEAPASTEDTFVEGDSSTSASATLVLPLTIRQGLGLGVWPIPTGFVGIVSDEDQLAGSGWRKEILPLVLNALGEKGATPLESALKTLESPTQTVAVQVIAFRIASDGHNDFTDSVEMNHYRSRTLQIATTIFNDQQADPKLREMA